jgi:hypothetical protein
MRRFLLFDPAAIIGYLKITFQLDLAKEETCNAHIICRQLVSSFGPLSPSIL